MNTKKIINLILTLVVLSSLVLAGKSPVRASAPEQSVLKGLGPTQNTKISPADRQAAAKRGAEAGLVIPAANTANATNTASMAPAGTTPHYFGPFANYANSPLRLPDALVTISGNGSGADASATVDPATGAISAVTVNNGGSGYSTSPTVAINSAIVSTGTGAVATARISGAVSTLKLLIGGSGYTNPVTVKLVGDGTGATATASVSPTGFVSGVTVLNGGSGYTVASVGLAGDGTGATASATITPIGFLTAATVSNGGYGYTIANVDVGGDGTGATAEATITPTNFLSGAIVTNAGSGYTNATVEISGDGTGATGEAVIDTATSSITGINLTNPGSGYTVATLTINGDGTGATADAILNNTIGAITAITITNPGSGYTTATLTINGDGTGATAEASLDTVTGPITAINVTNGGTGFTTAPLVSISGDGSGAEAAASVDTTSGPITSLSLTNAGSGYSTAPTVEFVGGTGASASAVISGSVTAITVVSGGTGYVTPGIRKFVDSLPGLGEAGANNLGNYIPVAQADTSTYAGTDYYEIAVVEYQQQFHSDLPATRLRGYVQLSTNVIPGKQIHLKNLDGSPIKLANGSDAIAVDNPHYLGPIISATKDRPVRILFRNLLPTGVAGNLFIPVDTTVMGAGMGPNMGGMADPDPRNPMCGDLNKSVDCYSENRATLHLHGGISPWISDGTPHQWVTPAGENTAYPKGVSVSNVPDMPDPGPGAMTFFYTNQQSARLMFYHDHAWGITRLNVYAGEAAGYLITDAAEQKLVADGIVPSDQLPLIIQDKTFVPSVEQLAVEDPTWDMSRWGGFGQLWVPHVYMPAQNPGDASGVNQFGRWAYGPWFWPPTSNIDYPPVDNPYFDPSCNPDTQWCEPQLIPGTPNNSMGMEAFNDTPIVNGVAYPTTNVEPKSYRMRILNAANDRFFNLQFYVADATGTEVALNASEVASALEDPAGVFPTPDTSLSPVGPSWIQIGTEGGFLPAPVVIPPQSITWVTDPTVFNAGNVDKHSLLLGPAERADVIVDFSAYAGKTLILYNDSPAAFPARDPRYDYYTGNADLTSTGGAPSVVPGFGPNTRTIMQIKVAANTPAAPFNMAALQTAFAHKPDNSGVFESSQNPIIVGQAPYNSAYGTAFTSSGPLAGLVQIYDSSFAFNTLKAGTLTFPLERKAIQDEMGEAFEKEYGRMSGNLGVEAPNAQAGQAQNLILYPYINPATEVLQGVEMPGLQVTAITTNSDGTQIWKITHNGVDTHPIHFHLYDVQLINRVGWDGIIRKPDANELGWKDTVRISPLEDTIVAVRPIVPKVPFGLLDSIRPLNPMEPLGSTLMFNNVDINGNPITPGIVNAMTNFGWEYVWHCHILSHEEMDMMRPVSVVVSRSLPKIPSVTYTAAQKKLTWTDGTPVNYANPNTWGTSDGEVGYRIERATVSNNGKVGAYSVVGKALANSTQFIDASAVSGTTYSYVVVAYNAAGDTRSAPVSTSVIAKPNGPSNAVATLQAGPQATFTWRDNATNESFFIVERSTNGGAFTLIAQPAARNNTGNMSYVDTTITANRSYQYRVAAVNPGGTSAYATSAVVTPPAPPAAPSGLTGTIALAGKRNNITLKWLDNSNNETGFVVQRATNSLFTVGTIDTTYAANTLTATQTGLYRGVTYYFRIKAINAGGNSAWSNTFMIVSP